MKKTINVTKLSLESYLKLIELGYLVVFHYPRKADSV